MTGLHADEKVTVLADGRLQRCTRSRNGVVFHDTGMGAYADVTEGLYWCGGWAGEAVEALKAAVALTREEPSQQISASTVMIGQALMKLHQRAFKKLFGPQDAALSP